MQCTVEKTHTTYAIPNTQNPTKCFNFVGKNQIKKLFFATRIESIWPKFLSIEIIILNKILLCFKI